MGWQLAAGVGFCEVDGELVFLDLRRDRYIALRGDERAAFERLRCGTPNSSDDMTRLARTGLVARCEGVNVLLPAAISVPAADLAGAEVRFSPVMACSAAAALWRARRAIRPQNIAAALSASTHAKKRAVGGASDAALASVAAHYAACRWAIPVEPRCLIDALALDDILLRRGLAATLVFGVRLKPFAAHCWLQMPKAILTGTAAEARNFTPIMVVG
ncbi:MAG TPA: lasso peptide biosynthesis B2 protein [Sphingopyxis sp.]|nr:lasso peptide biosynthesis B2 protein [Sphingopyxis sp.]